MKILYLTYGEDPISQGILRAQVIRLLKKLSSDCKITYLAFLNASVIEKKAELQALKEDLNNHNVEFNILPMSGDADRNLLIDYVYQEQFDLLHCRSYMASLLGLYTKSRLGIPFIFDMRGAWPEERYFYDLLIQGRDKESLDIELKERKQLEYTLLENTDCAVVVSETFLEHVRNILSSAPAVNIHNFICPEEFYYDREIRIKMRGRLGLTDKFVLVFSGSLSPWYDINKLVKTLKSFACIKPNVFFLLLVYDAGGATCSGSSFKKILESEDILQNRYKILGVRHEEITSYLMAGDIAIIPHKADMDVVVAITLPVKFAEYLGCGLPVLTFPYSVPINKVIRDFAIGFTIEEKKSNLKDDLSSITKSVEEQGEDLKLRCSQYAHKYHSIERSTKQYLEIYKGIGEQKNRAKPEPKESVYYQFKIITVSIQYEIGSSYEKEGQLDKAKEKFETVIEIAPEISFWSERNRFVGGAHFHLGCIYKELGKEKEAKHHFEECLRFIPSHKKAKECLDRMKS